MISFYIDGGIGMHFFLIIAVIIVYLTIKRVIELTGGQEIDPRQFSHSVNGILFWGVISVVLGFLWHYLGLYSAMGAISVARDISPAIAAKGYQVSLITILTGMVLFIISAVIWYILRCRAPKA